MALLKSSSAEGTGRSQCRKAIDGRLQEHFEKVAANRPRDAA